MRKVPFISRLLRPNLDDSRRTVWYSYYLPFRGREIQSRWSLCIARLLLLSPSTQNTPCAIPYHAILNSNWDSQHSRNQWGVMDDDKVSQCRHYERELRLIGIISFFRNRVSMMMEVPVNKDSQVLANSCEGPDTRRGSLHEQMWQ